MWRCCSLRLSHPFTHSCSLGPLPLLPHSSHLPLPLLLSPPCYITGYACVSCRSFQALACRVQPLEGGFLQACTRWSSQMAAPSAPQCTRLLPLSSSLPSCTSTCLVLPSFPSFLPSSNSRWEKEASPSDICGHCLVSSTSAHRNVHTEENAQQAGGESTLKLLLSTLKWQNDSLHWNVLQSLS